MIPMKMSRPPRWARPWGPPRKWAYTEVSNVAQRVRRLQWLPDRKIVGVVDNRVAVFDLLETAGRAVTAVTRVRLDAASFGRPYRLGYRRLCPANAEIRLLIFLFVVGVNIHV